MRSGMFERESFRPFLLLKSNSAGGIARSFRKFPYPRDCWKIAAIDNSEAIDIETKIEKIGLKNISDVSAILIGFWFYAYSCFLMKKYKDCYQRQPIKKKTYPTNIGRIAFKRPANGGLRQ